MNFKTQAIGFIAALCAFFSPGTLAQAATELYLSDNVVNVSPGASGTNNGAGWQFEFDEAKRLYHITVPGGTVTTASYRSGDFQISTVPGSYSNWKTGLVYPVGVSGTNSAVNADGTNYSMTHGYNSAGHWMTIQNYNYLVTYTFYVTEDLSTLWVVPELYLGDYVAGSNGWGSGKVIHFDYDPIAREYTTTVPGGNGYSVTEGDYQLSLIDLSSSKITSSLANWQTRLYYVSTAHAPAISASDVSTSASTTYPLTASTSGSHWMTMDDYDHQTAYRFTVSGNLSTMTYAPVDIPHVWIAGNTSGYGNGNFDGLSATTGNATLMDYDDHTGLHSYTATTNTIGRVSLWDSRYRVGQYSSSVTSYNNKRYSCANMKSDDVLLYNTPYTLAQDNTLGDQQFVQTGAASKVKVYVDLNTMKMWAVGDDLEPYFISDGDKLTHANPGVFTANPDGSWTYRFPKYDHSAREIEISRLRSAEKDGDDYGFPLAQLTSPALSLDGTTVALTPGTGTINIPEGYSRELTISADGSTIILTGSTARPDLYLSDYVTNKTPVSATDNGEGFKFTYDPNNDYYRLYVEPNTNIISPSSGDFQISTAPGDYNTWKTGIVYFTDKNYTSSGQTGRDIQANGTRYALTVAPQGNTASHWMSIASYDSSRGYTFFISGDLTQAWVIADNTPLYIIGHLTHTISPPDKSIGTNSYDYSGRSIRQLKYDIDKHEYTFTMAGSRWSVFELSTAAPPTGYANWVNNMRLYPAVDVNGDYVKQPVLMANPFNAPESELIKYNTTQGRYYETNPQRDLNMRDYSINGFNPDWLYTVHVSDDLTQMWITEQPVNMPLKAKDFYDDSDPNYVVPVPHYFVVGTRTADWRLLPEWELKANPNAPGEVSLQGRFMYDGYFAIARVDNYLDYIHHRYDVFANSLESDQDFKISAANKLKIESDGEHNYTLRTIPLKPCGASRALLYRDDDPVHDVHNSITWDIGVGATASSGGIPNSDMMRYALPFRFSKLTVNLDADGNPTEMISTGSYNRKIINKYRTFSLIGTDINYETPYDFGNALGVRDLRTMTSAYADAGTVEKNWVNTWISYDDNEVPYYDAYANTLFVTAYDKNWQSSHKTIFDIDLGHKAIVEDEYGIPHEVPQMFVYKSDRMTFTEADPNDPTDEYAWVYSMHPSFISDDNQVVGSDVIGWDAAKDAYSEAEDRLDPSTDYRYQERLANYDVSDANSDPLLHDNRIGDNGAPRAATSTKSATDGWVCYVLKDVYLKGDFIVGSGWGGNIASSEGYDITQADIDAGNIPRNNFRLYFGNFSPRRGDGGQFSYDDQVWGYTVYGYDLKTSMEEGNPDSNAKLLYRTYRDIDETNFRTVGTEYVNISKEEGIDVAVDYENIGAPQYYNRIILWYNTNVDRTEAEIPNGVIQFVQESMAPNAKLYRDPKEANKFYLNWELIDRTSDARYDNWPVVSYQVSRYRFVKTTDENGDEIEVPELLRTFDPVIISDKTVLDIKGTTVQFEDPNTLPPGDYYYTVTVTIQNPDSEDDLRSKTATTNTLAVALKAKTATIDLHQQMETDADGLALYSFNLEAVTSITPDKTVLGTESSHEHAVWRDAGYISIKAKNQYTLDALNKATSVEITNLSRMQYWNKQGTGWWQLQHPGQLPTPPNTARPFDPNQTADYIGWGLADDCKDAAGNPKFNDDGEIRFIAQIHYRAQLQESDPYYLYINSMDKFRELIDFPTIVWHNVEPNSNIAGADDAQYELECYMGPRDGTINVFVKENGVDKHYTYTYEEYWRHQLNFEPDNAEADIYAPSMTIALDNIHIAKSAQTVEVATDDMPLTSPIVGSNMPVGSMSDDLTTNDPVVYSVANEVTSDVLATIPLTQEVLLNHEITGYLSINNMTPVAFEVDKAGKLTCEAHNLPYFNETVSDREDAPTSYSSFLRAPSTKVPQRYQPLSHANYKRYDIATGTYAYDVTSSPRRGSSSSFEGFALAEPHVYKLAQMQHVYWCDPRQGPSNGPATQEDLESGAWFTRLLIQLGITNYNTDLAAYVGFHTHHDTSADYSVGLFGARCDQGGHPLDEANYFYFASKVPVQEDYIDWNGSSEYNEHNNWSLLAARDGRLSLNAGIIGAKANSSTPPNESLISGYTYPEIDLYMVYPIIPSTYLELTPLTAEEGIAKAPGLAPRAQTTVAHSSLIPVTVATTYATGYDATDPIFTGVEGVSADASMPDAIYTIQGARVDNPQPGQIYIVVRDGVATKQLFMTGK